MKTFVAALLVLFVTFVAGEHTVGGWSDVLKPPFAIDNALASLLPPLEKDIRAKIVAKVPKNKKAATDPIYLVAYKQQVIDGFQYRVQTEVAKLIFLVDVIDAVISIPFVEKVVGPLVLGDSDLLTAP